MHAPKVAVAFAVLILGSSILNPAQAADAAEPPDWARALRLVVDGGPTRSDVEVTLNGEFVLLAQEGPSLFHEIADLVKPGVNEIRITLKKPEAPREKGENQRIAIRAVTTRSRALETVGRPLVEIVVPGDATAESGCTETMHFWGGPASTPPPEGLKNAYWLYVSGPPAHVSVGVYVNDSFVYESSRGNEWFDATAFVKKGRNEVTFQLRPVCLVPPTSRTEPLTVGIGPAKLEQDVIRMIEPPQAEVEIDPKRDTTEKTIQRSFRAW